MQKRRNARISKAEWPAIWERYQAGESFIAVAQSYGTSVETVRYIVKEMKKAQTSAPPDDEMSAEESESPESWSPLTVVANRADVDRGRELPRVVTAALHCAEAHEAWRDEANPDTTSRLLDSVHAVKRALAAIEIELAKGSHPSPVVGERRHRYPTSAYSRR